MNIALIGAGEETLPLIRSLSALEGIHVSCVTDANPQAPGLRLAQELGLPTGSKPEDFSKQDGFHLAIVTSDTDLGTFATAEVVKGEAARLLISLARDWDRLWKVEASYKLSKQYQKLLETSNRKLDEKILELSLFNEMAKIFSSSAFDQRNIPGFLFRLLKRKIPLHAFAMLLVEEGEPCLVLASEESLPLSLKQEIRLRMSYHFARGMRKPLNPDRVSLVEILEEKEESSFSARQTPSPLSIKAFYDFPLVVMDKPVGLMSVVFCDDLALNPDEISFLEIVAGQAALFVENDRTRQAIANERNKLEAANKELEAFSYSVSHDLRAPLRHIEGFVDLLTKESLPHLSEKSAHYLNIVSDSAKHMGNLIDDLLTFSRVGRSEMVMTPFSLEALLEEVIRELSSETVGRKIEWQIGSLPIAEGDPSLIRLVLVNLIANALKFTRTRETARIEIGVQDENNESVIYVKDNGVGFDMQYANKLFGVFQRLHSSDQFEGTGIGLANVRRIIHRHGGRTWAEGAENKGAAFYFSLPHPVAEARGEGAKEREAA